MLANLVAIPMICAPLLDFAYPDAKNGYLFLLLLVCNNYGNLECCTFPPTPRSLSHYENILLQQPFAYT